MLFKRLTYFLIWVGAVSLGLNSNSEKISKLIALAIAVVTEDCEDDVLDEGSEVIENTVDR